MESNPDDKRIIEPDGSIDYINVSVKRSLTSLYALNNQEFIKFNQKFEEFSKLLKSVDSNSNTNRLIEEINTYRLPKYEGDIPIIAQLPLIVILNVLTDWQNKILLIDYTYLAQAENLKK